MTVEKAVQAVSMVLIIVSFFILQPNATKASPALGCSAEVQCADGSVSECSASGSDSFCSSTKLGVTCSAGGSSSSSSC